AAGGRWAVSAVGDDRELALFAPAGERSFDRIRLDVACDQAVVLRPERGWLAVCQDHVPGLALVGTTARPGTLARYRWDAGGKPAGLPTPLLGGAPVYDFDAVLYGGGLAILAVTSGGALLAVGPVEPPQAPWSTLQSTGTEGPLSLPALIETGGE